MKNHIIKKNQTYDYSKLKSDIDFLKYTYDNFEVGSIGNTILGRNIPYLKIGKGIDKVMINASHHANEWITSLVLMLWVENYINLYKNKQNYKSYSIFDLWNKTTLYIIPMVNPDGVDLCLQEKEVMAKEEYQSIWNGKDLTKWKANIRGVDLNLNYPAGWDQARKNKKIYEPSSRDFVGPNPLSEPESLSLCNFTKLHNFDLTISLHSQGKEIYWNYGREKNPKAYQLGKKFEKVSGYKLAEPLYQSSFAGYKDWFIQQYHKPGFTIELGSGKEGESLPLEQVETILQEIEEVFYIALEEV